MTNEEIMRQAMLAQSTGQSPGIWGRIGAAGGWNNPLLNIGMGILAANKPGASFWQAVGGGGLLGMQNYQASQYQQARMEELQRKREEEDRARQLSDSEREWVSRNMPELAGAPEWLQKEAFEAQTRYQSPEYGVGGQYVLDENGQTLPAQYAKNGGLYVHTGNGLVPFNPAKHRLIKPMQMLNAGNQLIPWQSLPGSAPSQANPSISSMPNVQPPASGSPMGSPNVPPVRTAPMPGVGGIPIQPKPEQMPEFQAAQEAAKTEAKIEAEKRTNKALDYGSLRDKTEGTIRLLEELVEHPGFGYAVGKSSVLPVIPGTAAADFVTRLEQLEGQQFLQAFESLKGGGHITEIEGDKAQRAIARMKRGQTEAGFKTAVRDFVDVLRRGLKRALVPGVVDDGYRYRGGNPANPDNWELVE